MTPGPTRVPERVLRAGARPMIHHRTPEFSRELGDGCSSCSRRCSARASRLLPVHTTGRGALEAAICNLFSARRRDRRVLQRQVRRDVGRLRRVVRPRRASDRDGLGARRGSRGEVDALLSAHPRTTRAVALTYGDTSTGVANDVAAVARVARAHGALVLVDGVSSIGGMPFAFDEWGVDVAVTASQKCLMSSPGPRVRRAERARVARHGTTRGSRATTGTSRAIRDASHQAEAGDAGHARRCTSCCRSPRRCG